MSTRTGLMGALGLSLLAMGVRSPAQAQTAMIPEPLDVSRFSQLTGTGSSTEITLEDLRLSEAPTTNFLMTEPKVQSWLQSEAAAPESGFTTQLAPLSESPLSEAPFSAVSQLGVSSVQIPQTERPQAELSQVSVMPPAVMEAETPVALPPVAVIPADEQVSADVRLQPEIVQPVTEAADLALPVVDAPVEIAQVRRRTRDTGRGSDYIGIGADFGYTGNTSFAAISKFSFTDQWSIRPSVLFSDNFSVLLPVTYDFGRYGSGIGGGYPVRPYVGAGASYMAEGDDDDNVVDDDDESTFNVLLVAGVDVPISRRFTLNGQINWGVLDDSDFGATVGVGYNLGTLFSR